MRSHTPSSKSFSYPNKRQFKAEFMNHTKEQMSGYVEDLENSLSISKQVIVDLLSDLKDDKARSAIVSLSKENTVLQKRLKEVIMERNEVQKRLWLAQQEVFEESINASFEPPSRYTVKELEGSLHEALSILKKYEMEDKRAKKFLKRFENLSVADIYKYGKSKILRSKLAISEERAAKIDITKKAATCSADREVNSETTIESNRECTTLPSQNPFPAVFRSKESSRRNVKSTGEILDRKYALELSITDDITNFTFR
eukprot:TRINITY_DN8941_c0_g3_i3.p1 TRINITY_DN8941_c0_g3~~TRINITY_DN8941_c0_g3_i3.p1  ORF type:complete len:280 (-),score=40.08 TRINITY_DN8941_c0_g3_i3:85-855(-)